MDTGRVNIVYRPLRICWAISQGNFNAFREAVRTNHALWGGHFNPIVIVNREDEARAIVEAFRADIILPIGDGEEVKEFAKKFKHLTSPIYHDTVFLQGGNGAIANVLDVENAIFASRETSAWKEVKSHNPRIYKWEREDRLADVFLMQLGAYPERNKNDIGYEGIFKEATGAKEIYLPINAELPPDLSEHPSIAFLSRFQLDRHYSIQSSWDHHGFYIGDASNLDDLIACWNLRAADLAVRFIDINQVERYVHTNPTWKRQVAEMLAYQRGVTNSAYTIWQRSEYEGNADYDGAILQLFGGDSYAVRIIGENIWNCSKYRPPMMHLSEADSLAVVFAEGERPKISFGLNDRPYATDHWFHMQHLVASVSLMGGLHGREDFTFNLPYVPELNDFFVQNMHYRYGMLRVEPERIGMIINAGESDGFLFAMSTMKLFNRIFTLAGFNASVSPGGLIARQLIAQLGGLQGGRVFKIPGARRLLKTHGPMSSFSKKSAFELIGGKDKDNPGANFKDHKDLYFSPRKPGASLTPEDVFTYLVDKRLFRIGLDLSCPRCQLQSWFPVDDLRQRVNCHMCGEDFEATSQLIGSEWSYRRSGVLGVERNAQGAIPVVLTLQQLDANLQAITQRGLYSVSLDLTSTNNKLTSHCEVDFVWLVQRQYPNLPIIIIGECKDRGKSRSQSGDGGTINASDINNLREIADSFPEDRFEVYILLAKLCSFTSAEIELAQTLNDKNRLRVIMLTERELEPYRLYERTKDLFKVDKYSTSVEDLSHATATIYFNQKSVADEMIEI